jgi:hypothetical protein
MLPPQITWYPGIRSPLTWGLVQTVRYYGARSRNDLRRNKKIHDEFERTHDRNELNIQTRNTVVVKYWESIVEGMRISASNMACPVSELQRFGRCWQRLPRVAAFLTQKLHNCMNMNAGMRDWVVWQSRPCGAPIMSLHLGVRGRPHQIETCSMVSSDLNEWPTTSKWLKNDDRRRVRQRNLTNHLSHRSTDWPIDRPIGIIRWQSSTNILSWSRQLSMQTFNITRSSAVPVHISDRAIRKLWHLFTIGEDRQRSRMMRRWNGDNYWSCTNSDPVAWFGWIDNNHTAKRRMSESDSSPSSRCCCDAHQS